MYVNVDASDFGPDAFQKDAIHMDQVDPSPEKPIEWSLRRLVNHWEKQQTRRPDPGYLERRSPYLRVFQKLQAAEKYAKTFSGNTVYIYRVKPNYRFIDVYDALGESHIGERTYAVMGQLDYSQVISSTEVTLGVQVHQPVSNTAFEPEEHVGRIAPPAHALAGCSDLSCQPSREEISNFMNEVRERHDKDVADRQRADQPGQAETPAATNGGALSQIWRFISEAFSLGPASKVTLWAAKMASGKTVTVKEVQEVSTEYRELASDAAFTAAAGPVGSTFSKPLLGLFKAVGRNARKVVKPIVKKVAKPTADKVAKPPVKTSTLQTESSARLTEETKKVADKLPELAQERQRLLANNKSPPSSSSGAGKPKLQGGDGSAKGAVKDEEAERVKDLLSQLKEVPKEPPTASQVGSGLKKMLEKPSLSRRDGVVQGGEDVMANLTLEDRMDVAAGIFIVAKFTMAALMPDNEVSLADRLYDILAEVQEA
ncbi:putative enterotoxin [Ophiocordyceps camponoti-rufipedis]|uniref:Putative enterotoxin n=1 Tax=Ophiocordyceps camponoti-rufipedis TaxID=2004952 RepID=A0A2C5Z0F2_9HYPO|nr:putative enterotoxin [Ophiocordyceps camponoti-rufipedis]